MTVLENYDVQLDDLPPDYRKIAEAIGLKPALRLVEERGGEGVYIPKADKISRQARNRAIKDEFDGRNHRKLARKYNLTVVMVRNILSEKQKTPVDIIDNQRSLF